jgi:hypothetical protein
VADTSHTAHDLLLVAAYAAGDVDAGDRRRANDQLEACAECRAIADDLVAISRATAALPPRHRTRDFSLTPADAARLRPRGWHRILDALASPRSVARPLAATLTTLGIAGLLLTSLPSISMFGAAGSAPLSQVGAPVGRDGYGVESGASPAASAAAGGAPTAEPAVLVPLGATASQGAKSGGDTAAEPPSSDAAVPPAVPTGRSADADAVSGRTFPILVLVSVALLVAGVGLFLLRRYAVRRGRG